MSLGEKRVATWYGGPENGSILTLRPGTEQLVILVPPGQLQPIEAELVHTDRRVCRVVPGGPTGWLILWDEA